MRIPALIFPACTAAVLLAACTTPAVESASTPKVPLVETGAVRGDLDGLIRGGAVGALATLTADGSTAVVTAGVSDTTAGTPVPDDHPQYVRVGSITKSFTAAIVLQLVAENRIDLDEPVDTYLPGLLTGDHVDGRSITVRHILGHRSGLPDPARTRETHEHAAAQDGRTYTPTEQVALALRSPARFAPGARFEYANINYIVVGMLIEAVTGRSYTEELSDRILTPLGLSNTYLPATGDTGLRDPHPNGYATVDGAVTEATIMEPSLPWASGALVSTGADLNRFFTALLAGRVVAQDLLPDMLDGSDMGRGDGMSYGLGVAYSQLPCGAQFVGNVGGVHGFTAISGATRTGRAITYSFTGTPSELPIRDLVTHALCD